MWAKVEITLGIICWKQRWREYIVKKLKNELKEKKGKKKRKKSNFSRYSLALALSLSLRVLCVLCIYAIPIHITQYPIMSIFIFYIAFRISSSIRCGFFYLSSFRFNPFICTNTYTVSNAHTEPAIWLRTKDILYVLCMCSVCTIHMECSIGLSSFHIVYILQSGHHYNIRHTIMRTNKITEKPMANAQIENDRM